MNRAVEELAAGGVTRVELEHVLGAFLDRIYDENADEPTIDIIVGIGDRLHGWCHRDFHIHTRDGLSLNGHAHPPASVPSPR